MLYHNNSSQKGFTITELIMVTVVAGILVTAIVGFFNGNFNQYFKLQADGLAYSEITQNSQRLARVIRGIKYIEVAEPDRIVGYSYFAPSEQYTSKITYELINSNTVMQATVIPMTADYPLGTLKTADTRLVNIINSFYKKSGVNTFEYLDVNGNTVPFPIDSNNINSIKSVRIKLNVKSYNSASNSVISNELVVNLRNRKTNL